MGQLGVLRWAAPSVGRRINSGMFCATLHVPGILHESCECGRPRAPAEPTGFAAVKSAPPVFVCWGGGPGVQPRVFLLHSSTVSLATRLFKFHVLVSVFSVHPVVCELTKSPVSVFSGSSGGL